MKNEMKLAFFVILLSLVITEAPALANDTIAAISPEGLRIERSEALRMKKEVLSISPRSVEVDYVFFNDSSQDITTEVAFPMPKIGNDYMANTHRFDDFSIWAEGQKVAFQTQNKALDRGGKDITAQIENLGLPLDRFVPFAELTTQQKEAVRTNLLYSEENADEEWQATFLLQKTLHWRQNFPAQKTLRISHRYIPVLGSNSIRDLNFPENWAHLYPQKAENNKGCCLSTRADGWLPPSCPRLITAQPNSERPVFEAEYLDYILSTGSNWKNGIEEFRLHIHGARVLFVEIDGTYDVGIGEMDLTRSNFRPSKELRIEFIDSGKPAHLPSFFNVVKQTTAETFCHQKPDGPITTKLPEETVFPLANAENGWIKLRHEKGPCWVKQTDLSPAHCP